MVVLKRLLLYVFFSVFCANNLLWAMDYSKRLKGRKRSFCRKNFFLKYLFFLKEPKSKNRRRKVCMVEKNFGKIFKLDKEMDLRLINDDFSKILMSIGHTSCARSYFMKYFENNKLPICRDEETGENIFHIAAKNNYVYIFEFFLGCNIQGFSNTLKKMLEEKNFQDLTPLDVSVLCEHDDIPKIFKKYPRYCPEWLLGND
jgi:hypothetical protein